MNGETMMAEMSAQPEVLTRLVARAPADMAAVRAVVPSPLAGVVFLARGSSDNAAVFGRYLAELTAGRPAGLAAPSLYTRYHAEVDWKGYLVVAVSQSGKTPEIITTCTSMRQAGAIVVGVTNEPSSPLADAADLLLSTDAGTERAIPATKTVTGQFALLATIAASIHGGGLPPGTDLGGLPGAVTAVLDNPEPAVSLAHRWAALDRLVVTGRGLAYAAALETALKVKETTGILAEGISTADLLHGPIAAVYAGTPVLLVDAGGPASADLDELRALLATRDADVVTLPVPAGTEPVQVIAAVVRGQQLAHGMARARGADPDTPANLSKVTATT
ncbi:MAG TPA: SIS domain-containing protein [Streptosporangiaceae bacterium]|nr:SIS domain-containing protein [Streptosporangiaceae bacterium]